MSETGEPMTTAVTSMGAGFLSPSVVMEQKKKIHELMSAIFVSGVHYGVCPGTSGKPSLYKPGAEYLAFAFNLRNHTEIDRVIDSEGHLTVFVRCIVHASDGTYLGDGNAVASTRETKYALRRANLKCPSCGAEAIIKGKAEYNGGVPHWLCYAKKSGCGSKFAENDAGIVNQTATAPTNPADSYNTVVKMGQKRALVAAMLITTAASEVFTQDLEDMPQAQLDFVSEEQAEQIAESLTAAGGDIKRMMDALGIRSIYEIRENHLKIIADTIAGHKRRKDAKK